MGWLTESKILDKLNDIEKYLQYLERKIDIIVIETDSLKNIEVQINEIEKDIAKLKEKNID